MFALCLLCLCRNMHLNAVNISGQIPDSGSVGPKLKPCLIKPRVSINLDPRLFIGCLHSECLCKPLACRSSFEFLPILNAFGF